MSSSRTYRKPRSYMIGAIQFLVAGAFSMGLGGIALLTAIHQGMSPSSDAHPFEFIATALGLTAVAGFCFFNAIVQFRTAARVKREGMPEPMQNELDEYLPPEFRDEP